MGGVLANDESDRVEFVVIEVRRDVSASCK